MAKAKPPVPSWPEAGGFLCSHQTQPGRGREEERS